MVDPEAGQSVQVIYFRSDLRRLLERDGKVGRKEMEAGEGWNPSLCCRKFWESVQTLEPKVLYPTGQQEASSLY